MGAFSAGRDAGRNLPVGTKLLGGLLRSAAEKSTLHASVERKLHTCRAYFPAAEQCGEERPSQPKQSKRGERDPKLGRATYGALMLLNESCGNRDETLQILQQQKSIELVEARYYRAMVQELRASGCPSVVEGLSQYE